MTNYDHTWKLMLSRYNKKDINPYINRKKPVIPIGTRKPIEEYQGKIPESEIVSLEFDPISKPMTERIAFNILLLGGSGDGKSLIMKNVWSLLAEAGYYCCYVDPKSTDSGRAKTEWKNDRSAPFLKPHGIKLKHYMPTFATKDFNHMIHNFKVYSLRLKYIDEKQMWMGLGLTSIGASKVAKTIYKNKNITIENLYKQLIKGNRYSEDELPNGVINAINNRLTDLKDFEYISQDYKELKMLDDWQAGNSICISYNSRERMFMSFDIGEKIKRAVKYFFTEGNRNPVMFFLDDASFYAKSLKGQDFNFALEEIKNIGFNYRSLGIYNCLAVQSLGIIDEDIADTYRYILLSPKFNNPDGLSRINVPKSAIAMLRNNALYVNKQKHLLQWILINEDKEVITFFPFLPTCNHFKEVYHPAK